MKTIIFGGGSFASLAWYCLSRDSANEVVAFVVDREFLTEPTLHGLPVVAFDAVETLFPPDEHEMLVHVGPTRMNAIRAQRCSAAKDKGYRLARYVSSRANIWPDLEIRPNCVIYEGAIIQPFATIGENVIVRSGVHISHHNTIGDNCFLAAGACLGGGVTVKNNCFIGLNATIRDNVTIAEGCFVAAGALITQDTEPNGLYMGVPAKRASTPASAMKGI